MQPFSLYTWMQGGEPGALLTVRLYSSRRSPLVNPQIGDFLECSFPGYYRYPFPLSTDTKFLADSTGFLGFPGLYWCVTRSEGQPQHAAGVVYAALREDGSEVVIGYEDFPAPVPMEKPGDDVLAMLSITCKPVVIEY